MERYPLFQDALEGRHRLALLEDYFELLYDAKSPDRSWLVKFWSWFVGLEERQIAARTPEAWGEMMGVQTSWNIPLFRRDLREDAERLLLPDPKQPPPELPKLVYTLGVWNHQDGRTFFGVTPVLSENAGPEAFRKYVLAQVAHQLSGLATEAVGLCIRPGCGHLFIRRRAKARQYCSDRCSLIASREPKNAGRKKGRPGAPRKRAGKR